MTPAKPATARTACLLPLLALIACEGDAEPKASAQAPKAAAQPAPLPADVELASEAARAHPNFTGYWQRGLAELNRYALTQSRYGETHEGEAVWIFVTEPFDPRAQVKWEAPGDPPEHVVQVLKLNAYRRFYTGVYPYTLMTSSFLPLDATQPLKLTFTSQEWCGQMFSQLNRRGDHYRMQWFSYFQAEGDGARSVEADWSEDALWSLLRRDPKALPTGKVNVLPALHHLRLHHEEARAELAEATLDDAGDGLRRYTLAYGSGRRVSVRFESRFPHGIVGFEEDPGDGGPVTRARRTRALMMPYWEKNGADDGAYREALGLTY